MAAPRRRFNVLGIFGPGLLVAATGVGAGDLATAGFAGSRLGTAILWAVVVGALLKFVLNEGLARWQLATGETLLEGALIRLRWPARVIFIAYLLPWSFFVGAAMISACGVVAQSALPFFENDQVGKLVLGAVHSAIGVALVWFGGYRLFERVMAAGITVMFIAVIGTAVMIRPDVTEVARGLAIPRIPQFHEGGLTWTIALLGGVGGTLTVLCYGYWIREAQRETISALRTCRIDLAVGYAATGLFGIALIVIAGGVEVDGRGVSLILGLAERLDAQLGAVGRWVFLIGAWAAVFSSLLGVWQAVPYIFADYWRMAAHGWATPDAARTVDTGTWPYRAYLLLIAIVPFVQVVHPFREVQKYYAVIGAAFIPLLALTLLLLNGRGAWIGPACRNRWWTSLLLVVTLLLFLLAGWHEVASRWS